MENLTQQHNIFPFQFSFELYLLHILSLRISADQLKIFVSNQEERSAAKQVIHIIHSHFVELNFNFLDLIKDSLYIHNYTFNLNYSYAPTS